ncbi:Hypothetical protein D9617_1g080400 [Elsinoe fawcettii]|nr:Hypothetical protein D9617_1g080400 [Elsinoe fawcettii]
MSELVQQTASGRPFQLRLLQHFHAYTTTTIGGPKVHQVMQYTVSQRAWNRPHLMHLALSVAAAHLKHMYTLDSPHQLQRDCAVAEAVHGELGLHLWREQISAGKYNIDADGAVASTFLTSVLAMSQNDETPWTSLDDEKGTRIMLPLSAINGFMSLRASFASLQDSSWSAVLSESDDDEESFTKPRPGVHGLPAAFVKLCSLETASTPETNRYHGIVRLLTPLLTLPPDVSHCGKLMAFIGRTWRWFQPLIMQCDQRGLLLLAYWFSLLRQVDQWWILSRAVAECRAIIEYLSKTTNTLIHALLVYPKSFGEEGLDRIWLEDPVLLDLETPVEELD